MLLNSRRGDASLLPRSIRSWSGVLLCRPTSANHPSALDALTNSLSVPVPPAPWLLEAHFNSNHLRLDNVTRHLSIIKQQGAPAARCEVLKPCVTTLWNWWITPLPATYYSELHLQHGTLFLTLQAARIYTTTLPSVKKLTGCACLKISRGVGRKCTRQLLVCGRWNAARYWVSCTGEVMAVNRTCRVS